jgi:acyl dehydratase
MDSTKVPLGDVIGPVRYYCDPDEIAAFALAINDENPLYQEGRATPPTYAVVPVFTAFMGMGGIPAEATEGAVGGVHGTHDLYIHKPIEPGMNLHTTCTRCTVTTSKAGMNVVVRLISRDDDGDVRIEQYWSSLMRGPVTGGDHGDQLADHMFPESARANLIGTVELPTTRDQTFRYAGASGDRSAMHVNDEVAMGFGFPRKFNQGLCTLGVTTHGLVDLTADGDPRRIHRIAVRFAAPTFPGDRIQVSAFEAGKTEQGLRSCAFEAFSADVAVLRHGRVEIRD